MKRSGCIPFPRPLLAAVFSLTLLAESAPCAPSPPFPIATSGAAQSFSFDGSNYLVGVENHQTTTPTIAAQMISASGATVGSPIATGRSGIAANVAFDGTNHLLIWEDDGQGALNGTTGWQVYGQFIGKTGGKVGSPFAISAQGIWLDGVKNMAFGGGKYLVTYTRLINPALGDSSTNRYIAGRIVSPDDTMGDEFRISSGYGKASGVAYDGSNFFVIWCEDSGDSEIRGRFVTPAGVPGREISINASGAPSDNPTSVAFDGTNYLVVWNDEVGGAGTHTWDVLGQRVSPAGALVGGVITITGEPGPQVATTVAFDGTKYLAVWMDMGNDANGNGVCDTDEGTCWDMYGQYIAPNGTLLGGKTTISTASGNQMGGVGFANGSYLVLVNDGVAMGEGGISQISSSAGLFISDRFTASGTYGYTAASGALTLNWSSSDFVCEGPDAGPDSQTVTSLTETTMTFSGEAGESGMTWTRASGTAGDISGAWTSTNPVSGNSYTATFTPEGGVTLTATIGQCSSQLSVTLGGSGSVNSNDSNPGIHASTEGTFSAPYPWYSQVTLTAIPSSGWDFAGWGGACGGTQPSCALTMDSQEKQVSASFTLQPNIRSTTTGNLYGTIASAFNATSTDDELKLRAMTFTENPVLNAGTAAVYMAGGHLDFDSAPADSSVSTISGSLTVQQGTLSLKNIAIK